MKVNWDCNLGMLHRYSIKSDLEIISYQANATQHPNIRGCHIFHHPSLNFYRIRDTQQKLGCSWRLVGRHTYIKQAKHNLLI